jgi:hypothetical protein
MENVNGLMRCNWTGGGCPAPPGPARKSVWVFGFSDAGDEAAAAAGATQHAFSTSMLAYMLL